MDQNTLIGLLAGALTTSAFFPQLLKAVKTKSVEDISLGMFVMFSLGLILWTAYGFLIKSWPVIITNIATLVQAVAILGIKVRSLR